MSKTLETAILLSTFNGEKYIAQQIESILNQTYYNLKIYIRDDGSTDSTIKIIKNYESRDPRIIVLDSHVNLGCAMSFIELASKVESDIYLFCDQDDLWKEDKVERAVQSLVDCKNTPTLYHTDLDVVDSNLTDLGISFYQLKRLNPQLGDCSSLYIENFVVGCTIGFNRKLRDLAVSPELSVNGLAMHDWWFALVAHLFGQIKYDDYSSLLYRQHEGNQIGAQNRTITNKVRRILNGSYFDDFKKYRSKVGNQARSLLFIYGDKLSKNDVETLELVSLIDKVNNINLLKSLKRKGVKFQVKKLQHSLLFSMLFK